MNKRRFLFLVAGVVALTAFAGVAGVWSGSASAESFVFNRRAGEIETQWFGAVPGADVSWVSAVGGEEAVLNGPAQNGGPPVSSSFTWVNADIVTWGVGETLIWAGGSSGDGVSDISVSVPGGLRNGTLDSSVPGSVIIWSGGVTWIDATVNVNATLTRTGNVEAEISRTIRRSGGEMSVWRTNANTAWEVAGSGGLSYDDGVSVTTVIPDGTAASAGTLRRVTSGTLTIWK